MDITKRERDEIRNEINDLVIKHSGIFNEMEYLDKDGEKDYIIYDFKLNSNKNFIEISFDNLDTGLYQRTLNHIAMIFVRIEFDSSIDYLLEGINDAVNEAHCEIVYKSGGTLV